MRASNPQVASRRTAVEDDIVAKLIPIFVAGFLAAIPISAQYFAYRKRKAALAAIRELVARDAPVDSQLLAAIAAGNRHRHPDLRRAILLLGLVPPGLAVAFLMQDDRARLFALAIVALPAVLGIVHLAFHCCLRAPDDR